MVLFDLLSLSYSKITPSSTKLHLATAYGTENPLDLYFAGKFEVWQCRQQKKNFERPYIIGLIKLSGDHRYLLAGCYHRVDRHCEDQDDWRGYLYTTKEVTELQPLAGRVIVTFQRPGRHSYLNTENWANKLEVTELLPRRMQVSDFPGYAKLLINKATLDLIVSQAKPSWRGALSAVAGVYVITDTHTGKLYIGSATGEAGIWGRWSAYAQNSHGGNVDLAKLLKEKGADYSRHFQYAILEIADTHASKEDVLVRESHWKRALTTREHGYNSN